MEQPFRTVLVTGGTGAIGSAIVRALRTRWRVVANYMRDEERALALSNETGCGLWRADVADENSVQQMFAGIENLFAVVHCAGTSYNALLARQTLDEWHQTLRVHADGAFLVTRQALQTLPRDGRLVLLASRVGERGNVGQGAYAASKAAVIALAKSAARESGEHGICVNAICPGFVPSDLTRSLSDEQLQRFKSQSVLNEWGSGGAVASTVAWLLSEEAREVSGQVIHCDSRIG